MPRIPDRRINKVAAAVGTALALAAVTAFGVAPLREAELPPPETIVESLELKPEVTATPDTFVQSERVRRGETVASLLERLGAADAQFLKFAANDPVARRLLQLQSGRSVTAEVDASGRVLWLQYRHGKLNASEPEKATRLTIRRDDERFEAVDEPAPVERHVEMAAMVINSSLFAATDAAGVPESIAAKVADILDAEIDLRRDLRRGAQLRIVYETLREADSLSAPEATRVLAVQLRNAGKRHEAVWFDRGGDGNGEGEYFRFDGSSLRKAFLRNPLEFSRVSSGFSNGRMHPLHGNMRAHKGVDFAAPAGAPVRASGDGVVEFVGKQRGYGNVIVLRHRDGISTLYAHLRGFAGTLVAGDKVQQGELIGFVGSTGWATGPHLHYEFMVDGKHVDPMTVAFGESEPLTLLERARFRAGTGELVARIDQLDPLRLAANFE